MQKLKYFEKISQFQFVSDQRKIMKPLSQHFEVVYDWDKRT